MERREEMIVTPEMAKKWLESNYERNRSVRKSHAAIIAKDIAEGKWDPYRSSIQDPIIFAESGALINGQHRLYAVIMANKPILTTVVFGAKNSIYDALDDNSSRSPGDALGVPSANNIAAVAKVIYTIENGSSPLSSTIQGKLFQSKNGTVHTSKTDIVSYCKNNMEYVDYLFRKGQLLGAPLNTRNTALAVALAIIDYCGRGDEIDDFVDDFSKTISDFRPNIGIKAYMQSQMASKKVFVTKDWLIGCILYAYDVFKDHNDSVTCFNKCAMAFTKYDKLMKAEREKRRND